MKIPHTKPQLGHDEYLAIQKVLGTGWIGRGQEAEAFEQEFSDYISPEGEHYYCLFTNCCTNALKLAYKYFYETLESDILANPSFDYPDNTYCATYAAGYEMGLYRARNGEKPDVKVNVHFGSIKDETPCLIEDSAHRIEARDKLVGKIRCYSFHPNKNMTTLGGGMFVTADKDIYEWALLQINDGLVRTKLGRFDYTVEAMAGGYEGYDLNAAVGRVQLRKLPEFTVKRNILVKRYNQTLGTKWEGNHIYAYFLKDYEQVKQYVLALEDKDISAKSHYPGSNVLTLPLYPSLTQKEQDYVIQEFKALLRAK